MAVLDAFPANSEDTNIKFSRENMPPDPSIDGLIKILCSPPLSWLLACVGALQAFQVQPFAALFSATSISHHRQRDRLKNFIQETLIIFNNGGKDTVFVHFSIKHFARYKFYIESVSFKLN